MKETQEIIEALLKFRNERDWEQFHNPKDLTSYSVGRELSGFYRICFK